MIIKIHDSNVPGKNTGSCSNLIQYLEKENRERDPLEKEYFFNNHKEEIHAATVERMIDSNKGRLGKDDIKFFMITVNPSERELAHIGNDEDKLKSYVNDLMDKYAENFKRQYPDETPLSGKDIMYFAKVEHERTYKFGDKRFAKTMAFNSEIKIEIAKNLGNERRIRQLEKKYIRNSLGLPILEGNKKDGKNMHVHLVVSRYDYKKKFKLSPMANQREGKGVLNGKEHAKGFNRDLFVSEGEKLFDQKFRYERDIKESYNYRLNYGLLLGVTNPKSLAKMLAKRALLESIKDKTLQKAVGMAVSDPKYIPKKVVQKMEKEAIKVILKSFDAGAYTNPITAGVNIAKRTITALGKQIARSGGV